MKQIKKYEGFWLGSSWVSRCSRCGHIQFDVSQEQEHTRVDCIKTKLAPISHELKDLHRDAKKNKNQ